MKKVFFRKKTVLLLLSLVTCCVTMANHPDSVYVKPDVKNGTRDFQIAYSIDNVHWKHVDCNLFESDYGPWGAEKKLHYPVLQYDGKKYKATFIPNPRIPQIATTESDNFTLWKPQDYPFVNVADMEGLLKKQQDDYKANIIRIPYRDLQALFDKKNLRDLNARKESENFVASAAPIANGAKDIKVTINVDGNDRKAISPNLMGIFFEDISYAADGGLYAELIQNRDFEYTDSDSKGWNPLTAWKLEDVSGKVSTDNPISKNNPHYLVLQVSALNGSVVNEGFDGIPLKAKAKYNFSIFLRGKSKLRISLKEDGKTLCSCVVSGTAQWQQHKAVLIPTADAENAKLYIEPLTKGEVSLDFVSLFPKDTFHGHSNGLRKDLAEVIADMKPRFVRFPGGCASHGQGIDNIYHWQATIGELWDRQPDMNIWHYHQSRGLGFYEYFQFCEDIGAEPLPVLAAGVPCQNSSKGGNGQQGGIPFEKDLNGQTSPYTYMGKPLTMESYLQELLDLIEWANGDAKTSELARMRAKAGHPKPFNMKYLGIGNEDLISDVFMQRYLFLLNGIKKVHPEITLVGTVGPFWEGSDYEYGWRAAKENDIAIVDEHYYNSQGWYFNHRDFYDNYDRNGTKVYLGEWASKGNNASNALVEAAYMTNLERNADVVVMSSYAPLLAKDKHTNWNPDLIYFGNTWIRPTANYYVQKLFGQNSGDTYIGSDITLDYTPLTGDRKPLIDSMLNRIDKSVVIDSKTGDVIVKIVSLLPTEANVTLNLGNDVLPQNYSAKAQMTVLSQPVGPDRKREWETNKTTDIEVSECFDVTLPAWSVVSIRIKGSK
ncbi:MAG: alpha-L-arabinofuranosidase [Prevotella sp.]|nr:alpha-L-arabinofuranosidase [Candidatus Prevotella equi]